MTNLEYIYNEMKDIEGKTPVLLIGGASVLFKKMYKGLIIDLVTTSDTKDFLMDYYDVELEKPVVIDNVDRFYNDSLLLKIIENNKCKFILLAEVDCVSTPLLSRIKTIIKLPYDLNFSNNNLPIDEILSKVITDDLTGDELDKYLAENKPEYLPIFDKVKKSKYLDKIIGIFGGLDNKV